MKNILICFIFDRVWRKFLTMKKMDSSSSPSFYIVKIKWYKIRVIFFLWELMRIYDLCRKCFRVIIKFQKQSSPCTALVTRPYFFFLLVSSSNYLCRSSYIIFSIFCMGMHSNSTFAALWQVTTQKAKEVCLKVMKYVTWCMEFRYFPAPKSIHGNYYWFA